MNILFYGKNSATNYKEMTNYLKELYPNVNLKSLKKVAICNTNTTGTTDDIDNDGENSSNSLEYIIKASEIHYEIDMSMLGCNPKILWYEIIQQIKDTHKFTNNLVYIICKQFHMIHYELLDIFNIYVGDTVINNNIRYILLSEHIGFINHNVLKYFNIISTSKSTNQSIPPNYILICNEIINHMLTCSNNNNISFNYLEFREKIYDMFVYNLNIYDCLWYIYKDFYKRVSASKQYKMEKILDNLSTMLILYNNNFRPIYHIERFLFSIMIVYMC